jgi:hypothetical protein
VLAAAAVVELEPVTAAEAITFLRAAATPATTGWDQVADHMEAHPHGALAAALSTPLMVALTRTPSTPCPSGNLASWWTLAGLGGKSVAEHFLLDRFYPCGLHQPTTSTRRFATKAAPAT